MAGKVWGVIIVQDRPSDNQAETCAKYLFLQEKPDQPRTIPCYDITAVSDVKSHLEKTFAEVVYRYYVKNATHISCNKLNAEIYNRKLFIAFAFYKMIPIF